jgi:hypothetical protein
MVYTLNVTLRGVTAIFTWWAETPDIAASARDGDANPAEIAWIQSKSLTLPTLK